MARNSTRIRLSVFVLLAAILCLATFGGTAFAAAGDSQKNATLLNPFMSSVTASLFPGSPNPLTGYYFLRAELWPGDVFRADIKSGAGVVNLKAIPYDKGMTYKWTTSSPSLGRLTFTAPSHAMYTVYVGTSSLGTMTVTPVSMADPHMSQPWGPSYLTRYKLFSTMGTIDKAAATGPIKLLYYYWTGGRWVLYRSLPARWSGYNSVTTYYLLDTAVPWAGTWRIGASYGGNTVYKPSFKYRDVIVH